MRLATLLFAFGSVGASCSARKLGPPIETGKNVGATNPVRHPDAGPPGAHLVATVGEKAIGPYLAMGESGGLVAYFVTEGQQRAVVTMPIDATGIPSGDARVSANVPVDSGTLVVRSLGHSFVLAWTALTDKGEAVFTQGISDKGLPLTPPIEVARTTDDVVWIAIVKTASGAVAMWAEETQKADANVLAVALDANGKPRGVPSHAARGVSGWQALPSSNGAVLAVLRTPPAKGGDPLLEWVRLDGEGHTQGQAAVVLPRASKDMDVARADGGYVVAWTDRSRGEPAVSVSIVDEDGKARTTKNLTLGRGAGSLAQITAGNAGALVAWEEAGKKGPRRLHLDVVSAKDGNIVPGATISIQPSGQPEVTATPTGFAFLGWTHLCAKTLDASACSTAPFAPTVLSLDARGGITNADGLPPADAQAPSFAWNLECTSNGCTALEATSDGKTKVFVAPVLRSASALTVAQKLPPAPDAPEIATIDTLASGTAIIDVAAARIGKDGPWAIASLASNDSSAAALVVRTDGAPVTITKAALPVGGVSIAASDDAAAVAWVTRDANDPQVHVTKVDRTGKKIADVQLTTAKGDASDVAIGADPSGGYVVAWVDARDGNGEVYATHIGKDLQKGTEQRITNATGDATDLAMLVSGDRTWLAWADARESPKDGFADIWVAALDTKDAKRSAESRVLPTAAHSRSPSLAKVDAGLAIAWIEEAAAGADPRNAQSYGAMLAMLDEQGAKKGDATRIKTADEGFATGVWLDPRSTKSVRGMVVRSSQDALDLDVFDGATTWSLLLLDGPATLDVPFAFAGDAVLFGDDGPGKDDQRLRRATVRWKK